jgi:hypothetical protein
VYIVLQHKEFTLTEMAIPALLLLLIATDSATVSARAHAQSRARTSARS